LARKSWSEKLSDSKDLPKVIEIPDKLRGKWGEGAMVIPSPLEVDELMRRVPWGKLTTINGIREALARKHNTKTACPLTTGMFAWISAHASEERRQAGETEVTPYWRTLKSGGVINPRYPGGVEGQRRLLEKEGHQVVQKDKKAVVSGYREALFKF